MKKYSKKLILNYINGEEIKEYNIDDLENSREFMQDVIHITKDKNMYNLCSEKLKNDYAFILFMVNEFKNDLNFIMKITSDFMNKNSNQLINLELTVILMKFIQASKDKEDYKDFLIEFYMKLDVLYIAKRALFEAVNTKYPKYEMQMGFFYLFDEYNSSQILMRYFSEKYLDEIFENINLEEFLHDNFKNVEDLKRNNIKDYLINFIANYDSDLSGYLMVNLDLLDNLITKVNMIIINWDNYEKNRIDNLYENILNDVESYFENKVIDGLIVMEEILYLVASEFNIKDEIQKHDGTLELKMALGQDIDHLYAKIDKKELSLNNMKHYLEVKKIFARALETKKLDNKEQFNEYGDAIIENKKKKLIQFPKRS